MSQSVFRLRIILTYQPCKIFRVTIGNLIQPTHLWQEQFVRELLVVQSGIQNCSLWLPYISQRRWHPNHLCNTNHKNPSMCISQIQHRLIPSVLGWCIQYLNSHHKFLLSNNSCWRNILLLIRDLRLNKNLNRYNHLWRSEFWHRFSDFGGHH